MTRFSQNPPHRRTPLSPWCIVLAVASVTAVAAALRLWGIRFGLPQTFTRPDEETIASVTGRIMRGSANPGFFRYPTLFMYGMALVDRVCLGPATTISDSSVYTAARLISALLGTATVPLLFLVARRLFSASTALVSAALMAVAFLHVRDSHFGVTDVSATFMVLVAFAAIVAGPFERRDWRTVTVAGLLCGLAASTKYNAGLILVTLLVAVRSVPLSLVAAAAAGVGFVAGTPYAVLARKQFLADLTAERGHLAAGHGIETTVGWLYHFVFSLRLGLGVYLLAAAVIGAIWLAIDDRHRARVVLAFPIAYYLAMGAGRVVFVRYMTPLIPFAALLAGYAVDRCAGLLTRGREGLWPRTLTSAALLAVVAADSADRSMALDRLLSQPDSRAIAAEFVRSRYPQGASVHQTGSGYGHVMLHPETSYTEWPLTFAPRLVILQTSWLAAYSVLPPSLRDGLTRSYRLIHYVDVEDRSSQVVPVFDQQDAFFVPLSGFARFTHPGPMIEIYERIDATSPSDAGATGPQRQDRIPSRR
jgi:4-amino-4-deoxy-L-arabinose transferase-like glycosyltransferase